MQAFMPVLALFGLGAPELIAIGVVGILLFGRRLPEIGKNLGKTIVEFKRGLSSTGEEINRAAQEDPAPTQKPALNSPQPHQMKQIASSSDEP